MKFTIIFLTLLTSLVNSLAITAQNNFTYYECVDSATNCASEERYLDAEQWYLNALRLEPANAGNAMLLSNLCLIQIELYKYDEADKNIEIALTRMPDNSLFRRNKALVSIAKGDNTEALKNIDYGLKIKPYDTSLLLLRAYINMNSHEFSNAQGDFNTILNTEPECEDALIGLASCYENSHDWDNAILCYNKVLGLQSSPEIYFSRGVCKAYKEDYISANEDIANGLKLNSKFAPLYALRGYISRLCYRKAEFEADKKLAIKYGADAQMIQWMSE